MIKSSGDLPVNLDDLIHSRTIEANRIEFKATWNDVIKPSVLKSIGAFANDLMNLNGGYILIGIEEEEGKPILPPRGLDGMDLDRVQKEIIGVCKGNITPDYLPFIYIEEYQEKTLLVLWVPAGDNRPYEVRIKPGDPKRFYIRTASLSVEATGDLRRMLIEQAAKIPFDDRRCFNASIADLSTTLVRRHLRDIGSYLSESDNTIEELLEKLRLTVRVNSHFVPRNVALLFFSQEPENFFRGARIEIVQFGDDAGGDLIDEKIISGPIPEMIKGALNYLNNIGGGTYLRKLEGQAEVEKVVAYPYEALEESIVNAVYHRSYENPIEPIKIYLYPDRMEITSYPGPVQGLEPQHFKSGKIPQAPARNRRIGEFLKELRLAEQRGTGIAKIQRRMLENGSSEATIDFDEYRTYFRITLPVHPRYQVLLAIREAAHLWGIGEKAQARALLRRAYESSTISGKLAQHLADFAIRLDDQELAKTIRLNVDGQTDLFDATSPYIATASDLITARHYDLAREILKLIPESASDSDKFESALLLLKSGDYQTAHNFLSNISKRHPDDPKVLFELALSKKLIAKGANSQMSIESKNRLFREVEELLRRSIALFSDDKDKAKCWSELSEALAALFYPKSQVIEAFELAMKLDAGNLTYTDNYRKWKLKNLPESIE